MIGHLFKQEAYKIRHERNQFGDYVEVSRELIKCKIREIATFRREGNMEVSDSDATLWADESTEIIQGDLILYEGNVYQVERVNKARNLYSNRVWFLKCDLKVSSYEFS